MSGRDIDADVTVLGLPAPDLETLSDYVGGALAGTPAEREVAERIATDPTWRAAHAALVDATARVATALGEWGRAAEPMPADVAERLATAMSAAHGAAPDEPVSGSPAGSVPVDDGGHDSRPSLTVVHGAGTPTRRLAGRPRWQRWAGGLAAAAGVLAFCGIGAKVIGPIGAPQEAAQSANDQPAVATQGDAADGRDLTDLPIQQRLASGVDYRRTTLAQQVAPVAPFAGQGSTGAGRFPQDGDTGALPGAEAATVPAPLGLLTDPGALSRCLGAIGAEHGRQAASVDLVDYASFEGAPAVVVVFTDVTGQRWAWAVGPDCGRTDAGADSRYRTTVG